MDASRSAFDLDPVIKRESIRSGPFRRPATTLIERTGPVLRRRAGRRWQTLCHDLAAHVELLHTDHTFPVRDRE